jgi:hypothetical protein
VTACACCGYFGPEQQCTICWWDNDPAKPFGERQGELREAQRIYRATDVSDEVWAGLERRLTVDDVCDPTFETIDDLCAREIPALERDIPIAFAAMPPVTKTMSMVALETDQLFTHDAAAIAAARVEDGYERWQDIPAAKLAQMGEVLLHMTPADWACHLPAAMLLTLRLEAADNSYLGFSLLGDLVPYEREPAKFAARRAALTAAQVEQVRRFLALLARVDHLGGQQFDELWRKARAAAPHWA